MKLEARDISFRYGEGERQVLAHVDLTVESGERVGIMAPSGFGKTTLLKILAGYERPESGEVLLDGTPLERFRGYVPVQMIWQHPELSVNPARRLKTVLAEGDWPEDGGVMRGHIEKEMGIWRSGRNGIRRRYPAESSSGLASPEPWTENGDPSGRRDYGYAGSDHPETDLERPFKGDPETGDLSGGSEPFPGAFGKDLQPDPPFIRNIWIRLTNSGNFIKIRVLTRI